MKCLAPVSLLFVAQLAAGQEPEKRWMIELESGLSSVRYNNARVPNSTGTNVDIARLIGKNWRAFGRFSLFYTDAAGGTWKLLYAPFQQSGNGRLEGTVSFAAQSFNAGPVNATYQFDSYRLTYRKRWRGGWSIGGTLKVRDAEIRLQQGTKVASERNVGIVPLLNVFGEGNLAHGLMYEVELDGLAGGPGRAIDLSLRAKRQIGSEATMFVGFRALEGGADVPRVSNFAWVSYITAGVSYRF